jgi:hypothetical protein
MNELFGETKKLIASNTGAEGAFEVPEDKLGIMNKSHSGRTYKHVPPEVGTGYAAQLEVLHQLHCVVCSF